MNTREAFEKGTERFNAHDVEGFAEVLADDVVFTAPGGMRGQGRAVHGADGDIPPTGRSVALDYIQVLRFRAGERVGRRPARGAGQVAMRMPRPWRRPWSRSAMASLTASSG
jgi:ketosteroid isomerase-like protein